MRKQT